MTVPACSYGFQRLSRRKGARAAIKYTSARAITHVHVGEGPPSRASHYRASPYSASFPFCLSFQQNAGSFRSFSLYQPSTRLLGIPDGVPAHATGSPSTLDFVLWNPNTRGVRGSSRECNRESVDRGSAALHAVYLPRGAGM